MPASVHNLGAQVRAVLAMLAGVDERIVRSLMVLPISGERHERISCNLLSIRYNKKSRQD